MSLTIQEMQNEAGNHAKEKGFHNKGTIGELLMLIVTEASEAMEDYRNYGKPGGAEESGYKLTDIIYMSEDGGDYSEQKTPAQILAERAEFEKQLNSTDWQSMPPEVLALHKESRIAEIKKLHKPCGFMSELADIVIRCGDLAARLGGNLEEAVRVKQEYNRTRDFMHGGKAV